jgi:hypothetical protein
MSTPTSARATFGVDRNMTRVEGILCWLGALCAGAGACSRAPDDLREWRPSDHRHTTETTSESSEQAPQVSGSAEQHLPGLDEVTIASYRRGCATCHGQLGRGDGPQGPMVKARDLSDPAWQASVSDAQIADTILRGRGRMPPFPLPPATIDGLVHLVRLFSSDRSAASPPSTAPFGSEEAPTGAPAASTAK